MKKVLITGGAGFIGGHVDGVVHPTGRGATAAAELLRRALTL